jgi:hypothetical protein
MRSSRIALATAIALALFAPQAVAEEVEKTSTQIVEQPVVPAEAEAPAAEPALKGTEAAEVEATADSHRVELGPVGRDEKGDPGRIHVVVPGDTLWDISDAYLGTPWVWPSIWRENQGIENPHLIFPDDRIWITATEMRKVSEEEAEQLLSSAPAPAEAVPAAMEDASPALGDAAASRPTYRFSEIETAGFVTVDEFEGAATIVDSHEPRVWLSETDTVIIGAGADEVEVGDQFEIFRPGKRVYDPATGSVFGFATKQLGWLEIEAVHPETSTGIIRLSRSEIQRGDHVLPRLHREADIEIGPKPDVEGRIVFTPDDRLNMAKEDVVFLDRGTSHGLDVGSPLEVYRPIGTGVDKVRSEQLALPDDVVAKLLVVRAGDATAVAVVTHTTAELTRGDLFRGSESVWRSSPQ